MHCRAYRLLEQNENKPSRAANLRISSEFSENSKYRRRSPSLLFELVSCLATQGGFSMLNDLATDLSHERYVVDAGRMN